MSYNENYHQPGDHGQQGGGGYEQGGGGYAQGEMMEAEVEYTPNHYQTGGDHYNGTNNYDGYSNDGGGESSFFADGQSESMPDVLHLLILCANAVAPSETVDATEAEESWEPVREWLRNHNGDEVRNAAEQRDDSSRTALHLACRNQPPLDVIQVFLSVAIDTVEWPDTFGWLPLHYASAYLADHEVIKLLTDSFPAGKTTTDSRGRTPLHLVLGNGNRNSEMMAAHDIVANLSSTGASKVADYNLMLPLHYACAYGASEEALYVLTAAHKEGIRAQDRNGRTPLHFALSNAGNEASPTAVQHLLQSDPDLANNSGGTLPLRVLADFAHRRTIPVEDSESVRMCLEHLLTSNPTPTADFFTALQSLPVWLSERAVVMPEVQMLLNDKISQRFPSAILLADMILLSLVFIYYFIRVQDSLNLRFPDRGEDPRDPSIAIEKLLLLIIGIAYFTLREIVQMISFISMKAFTIWFYDATVWLNITFIVTVCFGTIAMNQGNLDNMTFRYVSAVTVVFIWLKIAIFLRQSVQTFAVFWGAMLYILQRLVVFIVAMVIFLVAFMQVFQTEKMFTDDYNKTCNVTNVNVTNVYQKENPTCDENFGIPEWSYCNRGTTFIHLLTMLLGEVDDTEFEKDFDLFFFLIFFLLMVVVLATVLIAIVTDSYKIIQTERSAIVFWTNRLHFVAQVDAIGSWFLNESLRRKFGLSEKREYDGSATTFGKEFWKSLMDLFEDEVENTSMMNAEFWVMNILRVFAALVIIPAWLVIGFMSLGWLWPPQLRKLFFTTQVSKYAEATEDELRKTQVKILGKEVGFLKDELLHELAIDRTRVVQMKSDIADKRAEIANEMRHIKRIMTMLFDQQAQMQ